MPRYALKIAYDGTDFLGWQRQAVGRTVQGEVEGVLSKLNRGKAVSLVAAGRTDSGVHGRGQVAHCNLDESHSPNDLLYKLGRMLPEDVAVLDLAGVDEEFHARFDATSRAYMYRISRERDPFTARWVWQMSHDLDISGMNRAAAQLLGRHDFTALSKVNPDTPNMVCELDTLRVKPVGDELQIQVRADRFLYGMVRQITGLLVDIGRGLRPVDDAERILAARERSLASTLAPARGLRFENAFYPVDPFEG